MTHQKKIPAWAVLTIIAVAAALLLSGTYELTKETILLSQREKAESIRRSLIPEAVSFDAEEAPETLVSLFSGKDENGNLLGYVAASAVTGFGGEIEITIGMDMNGKLTGISVGGPQFSETAGLGARAKEAFFTDQFKGLEPPLVLKEDVDAITSATITSGAVVRGVNTAADGISRLTGKETKEDVIAGQLSENQFYAAAQGFMGPVYVLVTLDQEGTVSDIQIGDDRFKESDGYGQKAQDKAFYGQFIGKKDVVSLGGNVDAVSGATVTSKAVVKAVNAALTYARDVKSGMVSP